jgi:hypothetical protein
MVIAGGWWVAIVALTPAADRPFIDGSPDNSILNLIFVYNGFGRLSGSGTGSGANFSGAAGIFRLFNEQMGGQASWLLPAALIGMVVVLVARRGAPRTDRLRAAAVIWGGWLIVTGAVFSYGKGVIHTYYTVALAPAIAALVAMGAHQLWKERERTWARAVAALSVLATASWAWVLLDRSPSWNPSLRWIIVVTAVVAAGAIVSAPLRRRAGRVIGVGTAVLVAVACLTGPVAYAADAVATAHTGSIPSAGPTSSNGQIGGGGFPGAAGRSPLAPGGKRSASSTPQSATEGAGTATHGAPALLGGGQGGGPSGIGGGGGAAVTTSSALAKLLEHDAAQFKWVAAVDGSQSAASLELATSGDAVMAIGGFNNEGGNLSLAAFEKYVDAGDVHYYISGSSGGSGGPGGIGGGGGNSDSEITAWVKAHFTSETVGGETVYDLTSASSK